MSAAAPSPPCPSTLDELYGQKIQDRLMALAEARAREYQTDKPFPHVVMDNFLPEAVVQRALDAFPRKDNLEWESYRGKHEDKLAFFNAELLPAPIRDLLYFFNSSVVTRFLEKLTGIQGLIPDPYYFGGGIHQIERGGHLGVHADFNLLERLGINRRLNLLLYLNQDWEESYGGHLQLWDAQMTRAEKKILPVFNRCVVFTTDDLSYHGHPDPLTCPEGRSRKSMALYYYTAPKPGEGAAPVHSTIFKDVPPAPTFKQTLRRFVPPIVIDIIKGK